MNLFPRLLLVLLLVVVGLLVLAPRAYVSPLKFAAIPTNSPPIAENDKYAVRSLSVSIVGPLLKNDNDPEDDPMFAEVVTSTTQGELSNVNGNNFAYTLNDPNYRGLDSFTYRACDFPTHCSATATVTLSIIGPADDENCGACPTCPSGGPIAVAGPINVTNGNMYLQQTDYVLPSVGPSINVTRTFNSNSQRVGLFGRGWWSDYDESITSFDSDLARLTLKDGRAIYLDREIGSSGALQPIEGDFHGAIVQGSGGGFTLTMKNGDVHEFNSSGKLVSLADRVGNQTTLTYDSGGKLTAVTNPFGGVLTFTSNSNGQILTISDTLGTIATYTYTGAKLDSVTYADDSAFNFEYDGNVRLTSVTDALGNLIESHTYNSQGRAITSEREDGIDHYELSYVSGTETDVTDGLSHLTKYTIDKSKGRNVVTRVEGLCSCGGGSSSQVQTLTYDDKLNVTEKTDALDHSTTFTYDANGNRLTHTDATGTITYTYNQFSEVLTRTDQLDGVTTNTYDTAGNLLTTEDALNHTTTLTHDSHGHPLTVTDARAKVTTFTWDSSGRLSQAEDALNHTTDFSYDARARLTAVTNALSETTNYEYDAAGRLKKTTFPDSNFVESTYDLAGRRTKVTDARSNDTDFAYDSSYRLTSVTDALTHTTSRAYDAMSNPSSMTDALGRVTNYEYDDFNRLKKVIYPPATTGATRLQQTVEYDADGNVTKKTDTAGRDTTYTYDDVNRLTTTTDADDKTTSFQYDELSRTTAVVDALDQEYAFAYDAVGRQTQMTRGEVSMSYAYDAVGNRTERTDYNGATTTYEYDDLNRLTAMAYPDSTGASYSYDALSRLTTAVNENGTVSFEYDNRGRVASTTDVFNQTVAYTYDANGNRTAMALNKADYAFYSYDELNRLTELSDATTVAASYAYDAVSKPTSRTLLNGVASSYEYDGLDRVTRLRDVKDTTAILDNQYAYDNASQIVQNAGLDSTNDYTHDVVDRLITASAAGEEYSYDAVGNRTTGNGLEYGYGAVNRLETRGSVQYSHDANGNQLGRSFGSSGSSYTYDFENRLTHVSIVGTLGRHPTTITVDYKYDALGRRIERSPSNGDVQKFVYDGQDVVQDLDDDEKVVASYLNGPGIDNKIRQTDANGNVYFTTDHLGSTRALTDDSGSVVEQINYDSFGNTEGSSLTRYTYTGREFDIDTGLYYYRARWYDPEVGRFISEDPIGFRGGDVNLYGYVWQNPLSFRDPRGLDGWGNDTADWLDKRISYGRDAWRYDPQEWVANGINESVLGPPTGLAHNLADLFRVGSGLGHAIYDPDDNGYGRAANIAIDIARGAAIFNILGGHASGFLGEGPPAGTAAETCECPDVIYRGGGTNPGNFEPGSDGGVSFRDSLSNPYPQDDGQIFYHGRQWSAVRTCDLPNGSVVVDGGTGIYPAGHISVRGVPPTDLSIAAKAAKETGLGGRFPR
jgi:RHS repeat-associated protein